MAQASGKCLIRQARLLDLSHDAILVWRYDGAIQYWNRGAETLYGFSAVETYGKVPHTLLHTRHPQPWPEIEVLLRSDGQWEGELSRSPKRVKLLLCSPAIN
ncbi:MAG: PAS domain-containing protein [Candidatus Competibacteraceae bacterium]